MAQPCLGSSATVFRINKSRVPCKKPLGVLHHKALRGSYRVTATECVLNFRPAHLPGPITHKISPGNNSPDTGFELVQKKNGGWKFIANREMVIFAGS